MIFSHVGRLHRTAVIQAPSWVMWSHISEFSQSKLFLVILSNLPMSTLFYIKDIEWICMLEFTAWA